MVEWKARKQNTPPIFKIEKRALRASLPSNKAMLPKIDTPSVIKVILRNWKGLEYHFFGNVLDTDVIYDILFLY